MKPALDHRTAKKRIRRFFESPAEERKQVSTLVEHLTVAADASIFGGAVRDISLFGGSKFNGDIDIVVTARDPQALERIFETYSAERNKFGGYRLQVGRWNFDIWESSQTWAYKTGVIKERTHLSLLETTFFNWDAILFDVRTGKLHHGSHYFDHLASKYLELNLKDNPNLFGAFARTLRTLSLSDEILTGPKLSEFLNEISDREVMSYEAGSFAKSYLTVPLLSEIEKSCPMKQVALLRAI